MMTNDATQFEQTRSVETNQCMPGPAGRVSPEPPEVTQPESFRTVRLTDCTEAGPTWLVQGVIECGSVSAVSGPPGSGKTFLLIDMAAHVASGRNWFGKKVRQGVVLYIAAEAPQSVKRRAALVRRVKFAGADLLVEILPHPALLGDETYCARHVQALEALIAETVARLGLPVVLVIIDTIAASMGNGSENLEGMQRLVGAANRLAQATGAAVVLNHHPNASGDALRGHGSLLGTVSHGFKIEMKGATRVVNAFKQRDSISGPLFAYHLLPYELLEPDNFGDPATSCIVEAGPIPSVEAGQSGASQHNRLQLAVRSTFDEKGAFGEPLRSAEIIEICKDRFDFLRSKSDDATRKAVSRSIKALVSADVLKACSMPRGSYRLVERERKSAGSPSDMGHDGQG